MKQGPIRFEFYLNKLETLMQQAAKEHNPALWLYSNDARTPLFMLEALSKLYADLHNNKKFSKLREYFKVLEDKLGGIDYYDNYAKDFLQHPMVPVHIREYMQGQAREKIQHLNETLKQEEWLAENGGRIKKIRKKLKEMDWLQPKEELKAIEKFYDKAIEKVKDFAKETGRFVEMEAQVHELRRDFRWLSIYPQALRGCIQATDSGQSEQAVKNYLTPEIVNSKFNVMPDADDNTWFLLLEKNYLYALSWLIAELGKLKDEGLQYLAAAEALQQTSGFSKDVAFEKSFEVFGVEKNKYDELLTRATAITQKFIEEENLDRLVIGLAHTKKANSE